MPLPRPLAGQLDPSIETTIGLPNFPDRADRVD
jgi:hypothetical protein